MKRKRKDEWQEKLATDESKQKYTSEVTINSKDENEHYRFNREETRHTLRPKRKYRYINGWRWPLTRPILGWTGYIVLTSKQHFKARSRHHQDHRSSDAERPLDGFGNRRGSDDLTFWRLPDAVRVTQIAALCAWDLRSTVCTSH